MKRFWTSATLAETPRGLTIRLDGKPVKIPGGGELFIASPQLAGKIAAEWAQAPADFTPDDLPLTRLASTVQERVPAHRNSIISQLAAYGLNDLLCYRADTPPALTALQERQWTPWLTWLATAHGITLLTTNSLQPIGQPAGTRDHFTAILAAGSDAWLAGLGVIVPALGSLVLSLALAAHALDAQQACGLALLDERWQAQQWGEDAQDAARRARLTRDVARAAEFIALSEAPHLPMEAQPD